MKTLGIGLMVVGFGIAVSLLLTSFGKALIHIWKTGDSITRGTVVVIAGFILGCIGGLIALANC